MTDLNLFHQITEEECYFWWQQGELQNNTQQDQHLAAYATDHHLQQILEFQDPSHLTTPLGAGLQNNSQEGQHLETSTGNPYSQRHVYEPNLPNPISFSQSKQHCQAAARSSQLFGPWEQEESPNNSQAGQYLVTSVREPQSQRNDNEANRTSFQQNNQCGQTSLGTTSNRAGSLIPTQAAEITEQPLAQSQETSPGDCQNIGKFSQADRQLLKEIQKKKKMGVQLSEEEESCGLDLWKKRKRMYDHNYRKKKKAKLEEVLAANRELKRQLEESKRQLEERNLEERRRLEERKRQLEEREQEHINEAEWLEAEIRYLKSKYESANEGAQDVSCGLAELGNLLSDDEQPNVTLPHDLESLQSHFMDVAEIQNHEYDELKQRNGTGGKRITSSTREQETADQESNSKLSLLQRLISWPLKYLKK